MNELVFVGLGLNGENSLSLQGLKEMEDADSVFVELFTSLLPDFSLSKLERLSGKHIHEILRSDLEERNGRIILEATSKGKTVFLVPGDPFIATTHIALRIEAEKRNVKTRVVHGASIISAVISLSGLHNYKFGKTVTIPFPENFSITPYEVIRQNKHLDLHTLCLLDIKTEENRFLPITEALAILLEHEKVQKKNAVTPETLAIGIARAGNAKVKIRADIVEKLLTADFGPPPHSLIIPGKLHFMETEALITLAGAPQELRRTKK